MTERLGPYIVAEQQPPIRTRRTAVWFILSTKSGGRLGVVSWYPSWRRYAFGPEDLTTFSSDCLREIAGFLERKNAEHKATRKEVTHGPV